MYVVSSNKPYFLKTTRLIYRYFSFSFFKFSSVSSDNIHSWSATVSTVTICVFYQVSKQHETFSENLHTLL